MEKLDIFIEKLNKIVPGRLFGLFSITAGILGDIISLFMFPEYNFMRDAVSALCLGPGGVFFNVGNIFSGVFAIIFVNYLGRIFDEKEINRKLKTGSLVCANISCICFVILGVFCGSNIVIQYLHGTSALLSWGFGFLYITLYNLLIIKDSNFSKSLGYFGVIVSFFLGLLLFLFFLHLFPILRPIIFILPLIEWVSTLFVILWYFFVSSYMIYKKI
ncbi:MAG: DUF998 domain-containing protein [Promethearchaeota archaeon]